MGRHRLTRAAAVAALALSLAGCGLRGDVWLDADKVTYAVVVSYPLGRVSEGALVCWGESWLIPGAEVLTAEAPEGQGACRMVGELAHDEYTLVMPLGGHVLTTPDHVFLRLPALYFAQTDPVESIDVTLHAPGDIVATSAGATVRGSTATWTDADSVRAEGFAVTARTTASPPGWIAPAAPQPPGKPVAEPATDHVAPSPPPAPVPSPDRPPEDPSVWAPDA